MAPRQYLLSEANYGQLLDHPPNVAVLPWGATEAHNYHLPHGTDTLQAESFARRGGELASQRDAKAVVLPAIPFGNDQQQLDQVATVSFTTATQLAILTDVARSLTAQGIDRLIILNAHGGNEFKPMVRDVASASGMLIVVANFFQMAPDAHAAIFEEPGDHADEMETSLMLYLHPGLVEMERAGSGPRTPFAIRNLQQPGVWTPRPWSKTHPDTGSGDPTRATAEKGRRYFDAVAEAIADLIVELSQAERGQLPYV